jgi:uncharacterized membrane protein YgdD (TMEM256/DUF423 family)
MARLWLAVSALLGLSFVALLALSAHGPQLLEAVLGIRIGDLAGPPQPVAGGGKGGSGIAALAAPAPPGPLRLGPLEQALVVHGFHALALGVVALWIDRRGGLFANLSALGMVVGTLLFAAPIWGRAMGQAMDPSLTPLGGTILLGGWAILVLAAVLGGGASRGAVSGSVAAPARRPMPPPTPRPVAVAVSSVPVTQPMRQRTAQVRHQPPSEQRAVITGPAKRPVVSR